LPDIIISHTHTYTFICGRFLDSTMMRRDVVVNVLWCRI